MAEHASAEDWQHAINVTEEARMAGFRMAHDAHHAATYAPQEGCTCALTILRGGDVLAWCDYCARAIADILTLLEGDPWGDKTDTYAPQEGCTGECSVCRRGRKWDASWGDCQHVPEVSA